MVRIVNPVDKHFVDLRVPAGSFEIIARWFLNDFNSYEIKIVNRYLSRQDGSPLGDNNEVVFDDVFKSGKVSDGSENL